MKFGKKELQAVLVLLGLVAIGCAYLIGYKKITEKTAALEAENRVLKAEADAYKMLYERQPEFETAIAEYSEKTPTLESEFVYGFSTEDSIMYMTNLEDSQKIEDYILTVEVEDTGDKKKAETKDENKNENLVNVEPVKGTTTGKATVRSAAKKDSKNVIESIAAKKEITVNGYEKNGSDTWYFISYENAKKEEVKAYVHSSLVKLDGELVEAKKEEPKKEVAEGDKKTKTLTLPTEYANGAMKLEYMNMSKGDALNYIPTIETDPAFASGAISMPTVPDDGLNVVVNNITYGCTVSYNAFKDMVEYLNTVGGAKDIKDVSLSFDRSTGILNGYMSVDFYELTGSNNAYFPLTIPEVDLATDNIFGTIEFTEEDLEAFIEAQKAENAADDKEKK